MGREAALEQCGCFSQEEISTHPAFAFPSPLFSFDAIESKEGKSADIDLNSIDDVPSHGVISSNQVLNKLISYIEKLLKFDNILVNIYAQTLALN